MRRRRREKKENQMECIFQGEWLGGECISWNEGKGNVKKRKGEKESKRKEE